MTSLCTVCPAKDVCRYVVISGSYRDLGDLRAANHISAALNWAWETLLCQASKDFGIYQELAGA